jgi:hypothetical protein
MNRRGFLSSMLKAGVACMVMPSAVTYARSKWVKRSDSELFVRSFFFNEPIIGNLSECDVVVPSISDLETIFAISHDQAVSAMFAVAKTKV